MRLVPPSAHLALRLVPQAPTPLCALVCLGPLITLLSPLLADLTINCGSDLLRGDSLHDLTMGP